MLTKVKIIMMKCQNSRMSTVNEVFNNIKLIKMNAWEDFFYNKLMIKRDLEDQSLWNLTKIRLMLLFFLFATPKLIVASVFSVYIL